MHPIFSLCVCIYLVSPASFTISFQPLGKLYLKMSKWFVYLCENMLAILSESTLFLFFIYLNYFLVNASVDWTLFLFLCSFFQGQGVFYPAWQFQTEILNFQILVCWRCLTFIVSVFGIYEEFSWGIFCFFVRIF